MKNCRFCNCELKEDNWYKSLRRKNSRICKSCNLRVNNKWRKEHPESSQKYSKEYYRKHPKYNIKWCRENRIVIRKEMLSAYGGKCSMCGIDNPIVLDIDHINNNGSYDRKRGMWGWRLYRWLRKNKYPRDNFQLLCRNCNWIKHMKNKRSNCL